MRNPLDWFVIWLLRRRMRKHNYSERVIKAVISYYTRPKKYETV